jgi:hypothetical protein
MIGFKELPKNERMIFEGMSMIMKKWENMKGDFGIGEKFEGNGIFLQFFYFAFGFPILRQILLQFENGECFLFILSFLLPHPPCILQNSWSTGLYHIMSHGTFESMKWVVKEGSIRGVIRNV